MIFHSFTSFVPLCRLYCLHGGAEYDIITSNIDVLFIAEQPRWKAHFCIPRKELLPSSLRDATSLGEGG